MQALNVENSIAEAKQNLNEIIEFIIENANDLQAYEAEKHAFFSLFAVGRNLLEIYFATTGTGDIGSSILAEDGKVLEKQPGLRKRECVSVFGSVDVMRTLYWTKGEQGIYPLDGQVNLPKRSFSYFLQEFMIRFCVDGVYADAAKNIEWVFGQNIPEASFESVIRDADKDYDHFYESEVVKVTKLEGTNDMIEVSFDGKGVPMVKKEAAKLKAKLGKGEKRQKKKEALVGVCCVAPRKQRTAAEVATSLVYPEEARDGETKGKGSGKKEKSKTIVKAREIRRMASLARPKEEVIEAMRIDAEKRDPNHEHTLALVMDGALSLWNLAPKFFVAWKLLFLILDIIHVRDYLWVAANALYGEKSDVGKKWVYDKLLAILEGRVGGVIAGIRQSVTKQGNKLKKYQKDALERAAKYFDNHKDFMKYDEYLAMGLPIASGIVESACGSVVKNRMEGCGKRWTVEGGEPILLLRSIVKSGHFKEYTQHHAEMERERNYGMAYTYGITRTNRGLAS